MKVTNTEQTQRTSSNTRWPIPKRYRGIMARALAGEGGRANAIRAKCIECCGFDRRLANCTSPNCPLYMFNPYRKKPRSGPKRRKSASRRSNATEPTPGTPPASCGQE